MSKKGGLSDVSADIESYLEQMPLSVFQADNLTALFSSSDETESHPV